MSRGRQLAAVAAGGALGTLGRWMLAEVLPVAVDEVLWATLVANVVASALFGWVVAADRSRAVRLLVGAGVAGGLSTYSTLAVELAASVRAGHGDVSATYAVLTLVAGIGAAVLSGAATKARARGGVEVTR